MKDEDFTIDKFKPGSSGEGELYRTLLKKSELLLKSNIKSTTYNKYKISS